MKVAIVIPVFNKEKQVEMSIKSALTQTHPETEIIVVNDGSTDGSRNIIESLATGTENLRVINQKNQGLSAARNAGLLHLSSEYVLFHDADDKLENRAVEKLLAVAQRHSSDIVGGVYRRHTPSRTIVSDAFRKNDYEMNFRSDTALAKKYCLNFSSCNKIFKVDFLRSHNIEFTPGLYMQDIEFWLKCMVSASKICQTEIVVSNYFYYPNSGSQAKTPERFESLFTLSKNLRLIAENSKLEHFSVIRSHALMQGALRFFADWKLDEWKKTQKQADLERIKTVLEEIPDTHFVSFLERNRGPTIATQLLIRQGKYKEAYRLKENAYTKGAAWRKVLAHLNSVDKICNFSRNIGRTPIRNSVYEMYYLAPVYLKHPKLIISAAARLGNRVWHRTGRSFYRLGKRLFSKSLRLGKRLFSKSLHLGKRLFSTCLHLGKRLFSTCLHLRKRLFSTCLFLVKKHAIRRKQKKIGVAPPGEKTAICEPFNLEPKEGKKKFLIFGLGNIYAPGGVQLSYARLFSYLCKQGHVIEFCTHWKPVTTDDDPTRKPKPYYSFPAEVFVRHYRLSDTEKSWEEIRNIAKKSNPDCILVVNSGQPSLIVTAALYDLPYPVVHSERGSPDFTLEHNWCSVTQRHLTHLSVELSHVLMPNYVRAAPNFLHEWVVNIPSVTEKGIGSAEVAKPDKEGRYKIIYSGRLSFSKDVHYLLEAFSHLATQFPEWDILLVGGGKEEEALKALTKDLGLVRRVEFTGDLADIAQVFKSYLKAHIFVLPSRAEGCPLSLREAMAHGLPVIGYDNCTGTNEIIEHGYNGLLAESTDKVTGLRDALSTLMVNASLRKMMGGNGSQVVEQYSPKLVHTATEKLLIDAAAWKGQRTRLRDIKRTKNKEQYQYLEEILKEVVKSGKSRNIVAYGGNIRLGRADAQITCDYLTLYGTCLFDRFLYYKNNFDAKLAGQDPLEHYLTIGWQNHLNPHPDLALNKYFEREMDSRALVPPLVHLYFNNRDNLLQKYMSRDLLEIFKQERIPEAKRLNTLTKQQKNAIAVELRSRIQWTPFSQKELKELLQ